MASIEFPVGVEQGLLSEAVKRRRRKQSAGSCDRHSRWWADASDAAALPWLGPTVVSL